MKSCACPVRPRRRFERLDAQRRGRRRSPAGSRGTRSPGRSCPRPSARAGATTVRPAAPPGSLRDAPAARACAGIGDPGQPASDSSPRSCAIAGGREQLRAACGVRSVAELDDVDLAIGRRRRERLAGRRAPASAFSTTQWRGARATSIVCAGSTSLGRRRRRADSARRRAVAATSSRAAPSTATPAARSIDVRRISGSPISAVGSSLSMRSKSAMPSASDRTLPAQS